MKGWDITIHKHLTCIRPSREFEQHSECIIIFHLRSFHFCFSLSTSQVLCIEWSAVVSKRGCYNIIYAHLKFVCQHDGL